MVALRRNARSSIRDHSSRTGDRAYTLFTLGPTGRGCGAGHGLNQPWPAPAAVEALAEVVEAEAVDRRQFLVLVGMTLTSAAHEWLFGPARVVASLHGERAGHELIDDLEHVIGTKRHRDDAIGGGTLLPSVREDLRLVVSMLRNAACPEDVGRRVHGVAAEMGRLAGWLAYDSDQHALAQRFWLAALRAAHVSGERATGANVLGFMSVQAALSERPLDAVRDQRRLARFRAAAAPYEGSAAVREFDAEYRDLVAPAMAATNL